MAVVMSSFSEKEIEGHIDRLNEAISEDVKERSDLQEKVKTKIIEIKNNEMLSVRPEFYKERVHNLKLEKVGMIAQMELITVQIEKQKFERKFYENQMKKLINKELRAAQEKMKEQQLKLNRYKPY